MYLFTACFLRATRVETKTRRLTAAALLQKKEKKEKSNSLNLEFLQWNFMLLLLPDGDV